LGLHRNIERRNGFVADDEFWLDRDRTGDADALALAAGKFVRVAAQMIGFEIDFFEQGGCPIASVAAIGANFLNYHRLGQRRFDRHSWVERTVRVLEDDLHPASHASQGAGAQLGHIDTVKMDLATGRFEKPQDGSAGGRFTAARLAHQAKRLALVNLKANAIDCSDMIDHARQESAAHGKVNLQIAYFE